MNKLLTAAAGLSVAALPVLGLGIASAQEDGPPLVVDPAVACGTVTLTANVNSTFTENDRYVIAVDGGAEGELGVELGRFEVFHVGDAVSKTFTFPEDAHGGIAVVVWNTLQAPESNAAVRGAVEVNTDCTDAEPPAEGDECEITDGPDADELAHRNEDLQCESDTPGPDADDPPATTTPPADDPANVFNCVDFPLSDDRTAQDVLDADPADPHGLDTDNDGVACEVDQPDDDGLDNVSADDDDDDTVVVTPQGGVSTGGGPA